MEIYQIRAFVTVARLGHLTRAAEALSLTQPAVSAQIKALEQSLGVALFERSAGRMVLARSGEALLPTAEALLVLGPSSSPKRSSCKAPCKARSTWACPANARTFCAWATWRRP